VTLGGSSSSPGKLGRNPDGEWKKRTSRLEERESRNVLDMLKAGTTKAEVERSENIAPVEEDRGK